MNKQTLLRNVRPWGGAPVDVLMVDGVIQQMVPNISVNEAMTVYEGQAQLLLPGLVNAHAHIDKNLFGRPWHANQTPEPRRIRDYVDNERRLRRELKLDTRVQSALEVQRAIGAGVTHIRT
ncbi:MAG: hypothetical protein KDE50_15080, partial [Caldilineaceae bacterium]|nr:hypothetical protein [Caldilineaceae bacterium]